MDVGDWRRGEGVGAPLLEIGAAATNGDVQHTRAGLQRDRANLQRVRAGFQRAHAGNN